MVRRSTSGGIIAATACWALAASAGPALRTGSMGYQRVTAGRRHQAAHGQPSRCSRPSIWNGSIRPLQAQPDRRRGQRRSTHCTNRAMAARSEARGRPDTRRAAHLGWARRWSPARSKPARTIRSGRYQWPFWRLGDHLRPSPVRRRLTTNSSTIATSASALHGCSICHPTKNRSLLCARSKTT